MRPEAQPGDEIVAEEAVRAYREDGAVCLRGAIAPEWIELLARGVDRNIAAPGPTAQFYSGGTAEADGFFFADHAMWQAIPEYEDFIRHSPAAEIAGRLMGAERTAIFFDNLIVKNKGTADRTPWHQDIPYWQIEGAQVCSLWLPLDPVPRENSPEYVRGSHLWGKTYKPKSFYDPDSDYSRRPEALDRIPDFDREREKHEFLSWAMEPGDIQAFTGVTVHGAPGNTSGRRRRAFVTRWAGEEARFAVRPGHMHPKFPDCGLKHGDPIDCETFPVVWRKDARAA
ncbi:MAG: phytanoyl-CoA dioxygenase family protein [Proteobacteria bacterium]|nr:phytanoyl-CoA dioxygenase family protein [Pseudomonadota bacterium]